MAFAVFCQKKRHIFINLKNTTMKFFSKIQQNQLIMPNTDDNEFVGTSLEEKVRAAETSQAPIEAVSPMIYTERKDGVLPEYNIRTDKWSIAQEAMTAISQASRDRRKKETDKPIGNSELTDSKPTENQ